MPGFERLNNNEKTQLMKEYFYFSIGVLAFKLFKVYGNCGRRDFFLMLDDYFQLDSNLMALVMNDYIRDLIFEFNFYLKSLDLTDQELGLFMPFIMTMSSKSILKLFKFFLFFVLFIK